MNFTATLTDRKWMKSAKAYRMHFELDSLETAVAMTGKIEKNIQMRLAHSQYPQIQAVIDPCHIVDVPHKAKKFTLVCETCSECQNFIGELLTPVIWDTFNLTTSEIGDQPAEHKPSRGTISEQALKGLHSAFFQNRMFWHYIESKTSISIETPAECKTAYKDMLGVSSCKDIDHNDYTAVRLGFNEWLSKRGTGGRR